MTNKNMLLLTSALVALASLGGVAHAQSTASQTANNNDNATSVSDVVVTVNKREEKIEDVPVAVTAYTPEQRDILGVQSIFDFTRAVPSFEYSTALDRSFIRGVGRNTNAPGTQAGVAVYIDGVFSSSTYGLDRAPILSGNFEADAGPQGTLFGRNSIGGVLQQTSAHATDHFETNVDLRYNDHERYDEAVTIGGPIAGNQDFKLLLGADIRNQKKGYFHNLLTHLDTAGPTSERLYFGMLDFKGGNLLDGFFKLEASGFNRKLSAYSQYGSAPSEVNPLSNDYSTGATALNLNQFTNCQAMPGGVVSPTNPSGYLAGTYVEVHNYYSLNGYRSIQGGCLPNQPGATTYYDPTNPAATNIYNIRTDFRTYAKSKGNWDTVLQNTAHLGPVDLKYIGGYTQYVYDNRQDSDGTGRGAFTFLPGGTNGVANGTLPAVTINPIVGQYYEKRHWYSHEFNFTNADKSRFNWILGLYYFSDDFDNIVDNYSTAQNELATTFLPFTNTPGAINPNHNYYYLEGHAFTQSKAIFGQFDYAITDKWKLTVGYRWNRDDTQTIENDHYFDFVPGTIYSPYNPVTHQYNTSDVTNLFGIGATCNPAANPAIDGNHGAHCSTIIDPTQFQNERLITDGWTGYGDTVNLAYQPTEDTLAYIKYSRGYKAGGIVLSSMNAQPILNPETLNDYELGYKFNPSRVLTLNLAAYYYDYRNYQDYGSIPNAQSRTGFSTVGFNIPKSRNYGVELTADWHPIHALTFTFTGDYLNSQVTDGGNVYLPDNLDALATGHVTEHLSNGTSKSITYTPQPCGPLIGTSQPQCITGDALKGASPWKVYVNAAYQFDFNKGSLTPSVSYSWRAGNVSTYSKDPIYKAPPYDETDVRLIWQGAGKKYQVIAFVDNIFNKIGTEYVTAAADLSAPAGSPTSVYINNQLTIPRTWGLELQAKF